MQEIEVEMEMDLNEAEIELDCEIVMEIISIIDDAPEVITIE